MAQRGLALLLALLVLTAPLAQSSRLRRPQSGALHLSHQQERSRRAQAGYGDLDSLVTAIKKGKLDIADLVVQPRQQPPAQTPAQEPAKQELPQAPVVAAPVPAPASAAPQPVPIVNQPRGSLACSHQYNYGRCLRLALHVHSIPSPGA